MRQEVKNCKETGKFCYSSEAKAVRAMNRYEDIRRVYHCGSCDSWHTTKMGVGLAKLHNIPINDGGSAPELGDIQKRIDELKQKIDNEKGISR